MILCEQLHEIPKYNIFSVSSVAEIFFSALYFQTSSSYFYIWPFNWEVESDIHTKHKDDII
jgi:hypothetical protein